MFTLPTARLLLSDFSESDIDAFYATSNDPAYQQYYSEEETTREFWQGIFERILAGTETAERTSYQLAISLPTGELIGTCGVRIETPAHKQASFGCAIGRPHWGQGFAYEASQALVDFGFEHLSVHRLYAETIAENLRARALAERLGMRVEGQFKEAKFFRGRWWDVVTYGVLADEWRALHA